MQIFEDFRGGLEENAYFCVQIVRRMTEVSKKYRLNSMEEPTDEMLQELMEDVAKAAREFSLYFLLTSVIRLVRFCVQK